ncbi:MAG: GerW family sporulation protein, partial [Anaerolineales bacterium]
VSINAVQETMDKFIDTARVERAFGEPVKEGDTVIIPAAEVVSAMGFGSGFGADAKGDGGGGGGGGGHSFSRPIAVVIASPGGVRVEPVVDVTKISLAFFTALGFIITTLAKMRRGQVE